MGLKFAQLRLCVCVCVSVWVCVCFIAGGMQMRLFLETIENHSRVIEMWQSSELETKTEAEKESELGVGVVAGQAETCRDMQRRASSR